MRLGVFGGTFDPIHVGHLIIAQEALRRGNLDEVVFVPSKDPWLKTSHPISPASDRVEMVRRATAGNSFFRLSLVDLERSGPSYTEDTIADLQQEARDADFYFILGMDSLLDLPRWHNPHRIVELCRLIAFRRPGYERADLGQVYQALPELLERLTLIENPLISISSTEIHARVAKGLPITYWVPKEVGEYIKERGLYASGRP